jgi:DHA2 family multidrug resistance protein
MASEAAAPQSAEYAVYTPAVRWIVLVALMAGTVMEVLDISIVNVAVPDMMGNLGATLDQISWVATGYIVANVITLPLTGFLSSYFGRRRYLAGSIILFTIASILCGLSRSLNELVIFRIMQGVGGAALLSTAQATLFEIFPPWQIGIVQAIFGIGVMVGPTVGPTLGGWITDNYSWRWVFFINVPIGIVAAILTLTFMRESRYRRALSGKVDAMGILLLAVGVGSLQTMLEKGKREDWFQSDLIVWLAILAVVGITAFVWWELRHPDPAVNLHILKHRDLTAGTLFGMVLGFGLYGGIFILPVYLQALRHFTAAQTGWIIFPGGMATAFTLPFTGRLVSKISPRRMVVIGAVGFVASMWMLHYITLDTGPEQLFTPLVLRGMAMGFLFLPLTLVALGSLKGKDIGAGTGLFNLARQLGGSAGIAFLSTFVDHRGTIHRASLVEHVTIYNTATMQWLHQVQAGLIAKGYPLPIAKQQALAILDRTVEAQSMVMAFSDSFVVIGAAFVFALPLVLLFKAGKLGGMSRPPEGH